MIDTHRDQIAHSDHGSVEHILGRHKKVKQSIGDSTKLAGIFKDLVGITKVPDDIRRAIYNLHNASQLERYGSYEEHAKLLADQLRDNAALSLRTAGHRTRRAVSTAGVLGGTYALGKHMGKKEKHAGAVSDFLGTAKHTSSLHLLNMGTPLAAFDKNIPPSMRAGAVVGSMAPYAAVGTGAYMLGKHEGHEKKAMLPTQPPTDPKIQQEWRGRPPKMKDQTTVAGTMDSVNNMLSTANNNANG